MQKPTPPEDLAIDFADFQAFLDFCDRCVARARKENNTIVIEDDPEEEEEDILFDVLGLPLPPPVPDDLVEEIFGKEPRRSRRISSKTIPNPRIIEDDPEVIMID